MWYYDIQSRQFNSKNIEGIMSIIEKTQPPDISNKFKELFEKLTNSSMKNGPEN